jgi:hypothetical protein
MDQSSVAKRKLAHEIMVEDDETLQSSLERRLILEYNCQTPTELTLIEVASSNYIHYLDLKRQISSCEVSLEALYYCHDTCGPNNLYASSPNKACKRTQYQLKRLDILNKESDRVFRHYMGAINMLRLMKQSPIKITVNAQTAVVGQNQMVQANNYE